MTTYHSTGESQLTRFLLFITYFPYRLSRRIQRDAEALRLIDDEDAAKHRVEMRKHRSRYPFPDGRVRPTPRIWTRRDIKELEFSRGTREGWQPIRRTARFLVEKREHLSHLFRGAINEARNDGTAAALATKLDLAKKLTEELISISNSIHLGDDLESKYQEKNLELSSLACELMEWLKPAAQEEVTGVVGDSLGSYQGKGPDSTTHIDPIKLASNWLEIRRIEGGPTLDQQAFVECLVQSGGSALPEDIAIAIGKNWKDPERSCRVHVRNVNDKTIHHGWILRFDRSEVAITVRDPIANLPDKFRNLP